jgi:hypothetical protein
MGADITYIPTSQGFLYLMAIIDWHSQYVLAWGLAKHHARRQMSSRMATGDSVGRAVDFTTENEVWWEQPLEPTSFLASRCPLTQKWLKALPKSRRQRLMRTPKLTGTMHTARNAKVYGF